MGRAGVPPAVAGILPATSNVLRRTFAMDVLPALEVPGGTPGTAGETPALPRNAHWQSLFPLSITPPGVSLWKLSVDTGETHR